MRLETLLTHPAVQALGWALLHFVWQGALLAAVLIVANTLTRRPRIRYAIGCMAMLLIPVVFMATALRSDHAATQHTIPAHYDVPPTDTTVMAPPGPAAIAAPAPDRLANLPGWIVCGWLMGVLAFSIYTLVGWMRIRRLKRGAAEPANSAWLEAMADLMRRFQISRPVRLYISAIAEVPAVVGWMRPYILLPVSAVTGLNESQLRAILAHELAHIRRYDYLVNLLQNAVETLLFYHPAVWWVSRQIRQERENCCDDLAVEVCGDVMVYATALAQLEELRGSISEPALAATRGDLLARIRRLTGQDIGNSPARISGLAGAILAAAFLIGAIIVTGAVPAIHAQSPPQTLRFEVASVKPTLDQTEFMTQALARGQTSGVAMRVSGLRVDIDSGNMKYLISTAYRINIQLIVAPAWVNEGETSFAVHAVMPQGSTQEQIPDMLRTLLAARFHLAAHRAVADVPGYALVAGRSGPKLKKPGDVDLSACEKWVEVAVPAGAGNRMCRTTQQVGDRSVPITMMTNSEWGPLLSSNSAGESHTEYFRITMPKLAEVLTRGLSTGGWFGAAPLSFLPVVDRSGIAGAWDVTLDTANAADEKLSSYSESLEKQGLRLERTTTPVEKLVVDAVDRVPTEN